MVRSNFIPEQAETSMLIPRGKFQPKAAMPPYEVQPADPSGVGVGSRESGPGSAGRRVWKLREF